MTQPITDLAAFLGEARQAVEDLDRMEAELSKSGYLRLPNGEEKAGGDPFQL